MLSTRWRTAVPSYVCSSSDPARWDGITWSRNIGQYVMFAVPRQVWDREWCRIVSKPLSRSEAQVVSSVLACLWLASLVHSRQYGSSVQLQKAGHRLLPCFVCAPPCSFMFCVFHLTRRHVVAVSAPNARLRAAKTSLRPCFSGETPKKPQWARRDPVLFRATSNTRGKGLRGFQNRLEAAAKHQTARPLSRVSPVRTLGNMEGESSSAVTTAATPCTP